MIYFEEILNEDLFNFYEIKKKQKDELIASIWVYFFQQIAFIKKIHACIKFISVFYNSYFHLSYEFVIFLKNHNS